MLRSSAEGAPSRGAHPSPGKVEEGDGLSCSPLTKGAIPIIWLSRGKRQDGSSRPPSPCVFLKTPIEELCT